ncbi:hypothetical protein [Caballeronia sp. LZ019]|uniref:hypothetical protein n=1 Tax=Caballeronia sp. LZ019 TaxID=3038555 RepID=UPI00285B626C|nr:hypothetical protein [Caballeronia sp. LZ019]MDR5810624.1 hypothetical protein [Caballeronia sp. LZ019]
MAVYVVDHAEFREREDIVIGVYSGRFGYSLRCCQELLGPCIQHGKSRDIWSDAYHALNRYESAELMPVGGELVPTEPEAKTKRTRVMHVTCFVERARDRLQDAAARFTVSVDTKGRVRGEAVATNRPTIQISGVRVDPWQSEPEVGLAVLLHLASNEQNTAVDDLMTRLRKGGKR